MVGKAPRIAVRVGQASSLLGVAGVNSVDASAASRLAVRQVVVEVFVWEDKVDGKS